MTRFQWLPNFLTLTRLCLSIPLAYFLWHGRLSYTFALLILAGFTDLFDGYLARLLNCRTRLGSWLDPTADKTMITTVLFTLTVKDIIPVWFCLVTVGRDIAIVVGVLALIAKGIDVKIQPLLSGKLATVAQNVTLLLGILTQEWNAWGAFRAFLVISLLLTGISWVAYFRVYLRSAPRN